MPKFDAPLFAVSAAQAAAVGRLRQAAAATGGAFVDLTRTETGAAVKALRMVTPRLIAMRANGAQDLVASARDPTSGHIAVAGVLTETATEIELEWQLPSGRRERQTLKVTRGSAPAGFAAQAWARLRVAELDAEYELNRAEVQRLGKAFNLVTRGTSLIVLDRVEDYVRYEIVPPLELRADYDRLRGQARLAADKDRAAHLEDIVRRFEEKAKWWDKDFPKGDRSRISENKTAPQPASAGASVSAMAERVASPAPVAKAKQIEGQTNVATIRLKPWQPNSAYAERLRGADKSQLYRVYLDERPSYLQSTAFFLDAADIFIERGETELGLRVLSNLAEMDLENRHILRILGYRLIQTQRPALALPVLERVLALAPYEPQSWRDLGLAYAEDGQWQKAVDHLYQVVIHPWHGRFPDIELIALAEMNALIATAPAKVDTAAIEPRLLRNLPLDLRAVLTWDADNTDIDLWVTDPNGEKAFYGNPLTYQGGRMSRDFTGGYGPEEFSLKTAKPGKYLVQAQFYGHRQQVVSGATTLQLKLTTGFGTSRQQDQSVTLRLRSGGEVVTVGEFVIGAKTGQ
jgi:tetratricopeptide (TPR) repeat protein